VLLLLSSPPLPLCRAQVPCCCSDHLSSWSLALLSDALLLALLLLLLLLAPLLWLSCDPDRSLGGVGPLVGADSASGALALPLAFPLAWAAAASAVCCRDCFKLAMTRAF